MPVFNGTTSNDTLNGSVASDSIFGLQGNDFLTGLEGNDWLDGGDGNDTVRGGMYDTLQDGVTPRSDTLIGGNGSDLIFSGHTLSPGDPSQVFGKDSVLAGAGNDTVVVDSSPQSTLHGGDGQDVLWVARTSNLSGSSISGFETLQINAQPFAVGLLGWSSVHGGYSSVTLTASQFAGFSTIRNGYVLDVNGEAAFLATYNLIAADAGLYDLSARTVTSLSGLHGSSGADTLRGDANGNNLSGNAGNDSIEGLAGNDTLSGGAGNDNLDGGNGNDNLTAGAGDDWLASGAGNDTIVGEAGADTLLGGDGGDRLDTGDGADSVVGGAGNDTVLAGGLVVDTLLGGDGNDLLLVSASATLSGSVISGFEALVVSAPHWHWWNYNIVLTSAQFAGFSAIYSIDHPYMLTGADAGLYDLSARTVIGLGALNGSSGADTLRGDGNGNRLEGHGGNDVIEGLAGDDTLGGGDGNDTIAGGEGNDSVAGGAGNDTIIGGTGNDVIAGGAGNDNLDGGNGNDNLTAGAGDDWLASGAGNDTIVGEAGADTLLGGDGGDRLDTGDGADSVVGGAGNDTVLAGGLVVDTLLGGDGNDLLLVSASATLSGSVISGFEALVVSAPHWHWWNYNIVLTSAQFAGFSAIYSIDHPYMLTGADAGLYDLSARTVIGLGALNGSSGADTLRGDGNGNRLEGQGGNDVIEGLAGDDTLGGGAGNDTLTGGEGNDSVAGGAGTDLLSYGDLSASNLAVTVDLVSLRATGAAGSDTLAGIENVLTGAGNDSLLGDSAANILISGAGNDTIIGGTGNDSLVGAAGNDQLYGGANQDTLIGGEGIDSFCFTTALGASNVDMVLDYSVADDTILLDDAVFSAVGGLGTLAASAFVIGTAATTLDHRIIFNSTTGALLYDADGVGEVAAIQFATLTSVIGSVTHAEFQII